MGSAASTDIAAATSAASPDEINEAVAALSDEVREKLLVALQSAPNKTGQAASGSCQLEPPPADWLASGVADEARRVFSLGDNDGNMQIDMKEFTKMLGQDPEWADSFLPKLDKDKDGTINLEEWLVYIYKWSHREGIADPAWAANKLLATYAKRLGPDYVPLDWKDSDVADEARRVFSLGDNDGSMQIDMKEFTKMLGQDPEWADSFLPKLDKDKDGTINLEEWLVYIYKWSHRKGMPDPAWAANKLLATYAKRLGPDYVPLDQRILL